MRVQLNVRQLCIVFIVLLFTASPARSEVMRILEAENAKITCAAGNATGGEIWASGGSLSPAFWGRAAGEDVGPIYRQWTGFETAE